VHAEISEPQPFSVVIHALMRSSRASTHPSEHFRKLREHMFVSTLSSHIRNRFATLEPLGRAIIAFATLEDSYEGTSQCRGPVCPARERGSIGDRSSSAAVRSARTFSPQLKGPVRSRGARSCASRTTEIHTSAASDLGREIIPIKNRPIPETGRAATMIKPLYRNRA
jgi:hypothetical protein